MKQIKIKNQITETITFQFKDEIYAEIDDDILWDTFSDDGGLYSGCTEAIKSELIDIDDIEIIKKGIKVPFTITFKDLTYSYLTKAMAMEDFDFEGIPYDISKLTCQFIGEFKNFYGDYLTCVKLTPTKTPEISYDEEALKMWEEEGFKTKLTSKRLSKILKAVISGLIESEALTIPVKIKIQETIE